MNTDTFGTDNIEFLNTKDISEFLNCSIPTARQIMNRPDFPLVKAGKNYRVLKSAFISYMSERRI